MYCREVNKKHKHLYNDADNPQHNNTTTKEKKQREVCRLLQQLHQSVPDVIQETFQILQIEGNMDIHMLVHEVTFQVNIHQVSMLEVIEGSAQDGFFDVKDSSQRLRDEIEYFIQTADHINRCLIQL